MLGFCTTYIRDFTVHFSYSTDIQHKNITDVRCSATYVWMLKYDLNDLCSHLLWTIAFGIKKSERRINFSWGITSTCLLNDACHMMITGKWFSDHIYCLACVYLQHSRRLNLGLYSQSKPTSSWWCHQMETFSSLLALCAGNSLATGEFPSQRPVARRFDVFLDLRLNKRLGKQSCGWWFETPSCSL